MASLKILHPLLTVPHVRFLLSILLLRGCRKRSPAGSLVLLNVQNVGSIDPVGVAAMAAAPLYSRM